LLTLFAAFPARRDTEWSPRLTLTVIDAETRKPVAARFTILADGKEFAPAWVGPHGLRFVSVHIGAHQTYVATYTRGTGPVEVPLPPRTKQVRLRITKGFDYLPVELEAPLASDPQPVEVALREWNGLRKEGWRAGDGHLHFDRVHAAGDRDWFHAMDADGLTYAHFLTLRGKNRPGVWAGQFAYGKQGTGTDGQRFISPGEEYRDMAQGHVLLYGLNKLIEPIVAGMPESPYNYPVLLDVFRQARKDGGLVGMAHGGVSVTNPTGLTGAILGALDFWEIGNGFLWETEHWYRLMNCGFILPPSAGTDLPIHPYRDAWQPYLGSIRTYVKLSDSLGQGLEAWRKGIRQGHVFVSMGPIIRLSVNGAAPGDTVSLPAGGGDVLVEAELSSPQPLRTLELVRNGRVLEADVQAAPVTSGDHVRKLVLRKKLAVRESCWVAARGAGVKVEALEREANAHTAAVRILVGNRPIRSPEDSAWIAQYLREQREFYRTKAVYQQEAQREESISVLDQAIRAVQQK
jgi:hypothetical protein